MDRKMYETLAKITQNHKQLNSVSTPEMTKAITDNFILKVEYSSKFNAQPLGSFLIHRSPDE